MKRTYGPLVQISAAALVVLLLAATACGRGRGRQRGAPPEDGASPFPRSMECPQEPEEVHVDGFVGYVGVEYAELGGVRLCLDVYRRDDGEQRVPILVLHSGGFVQGTREWSAGAARDLARAGFVTFNADYRLAPDFTYPAQIEDGRALVEFVQREAGTYGVDASKMGAHGHSAGAIMAAFMATNFEAPIAAAVTWSAIFDFTGDATTEETESERMAVEPLGCSDCPEREREASPITYVSPGDPPMLMFNGSDELVRADQPEQMAAALEEAGVPHEVVIIEGDRHATEYRAQAIGPTIEWFREWLG